MSGVASRLWVRMTRSRAGGWGAAATSGLWQRRTVETQTAALNPHPKSRPGEPATWKPLSPPSPRWPHSSESGNVLACGFCCREITWEIKYLCCMCTSGVQVHAPADPSEISMKRHLLWGHFKHGILQAFHPLRISKCCWDGSLETE